MKNFIVIALFFIGTMGAAQKVQTALTVASYNVRWNSSDDGVNIWDNRKEWLTKSIRFFEVDVVGAQEVTFTQLEDMKNFLPRYRFIGEGREGGEKGEYSPVLFVGERLELLDSNTFWLSETPEIAASKGWDAALPRIVTWARFKDKRNGNIFYFFNTHFDHRGKEARKKSAELIADKIKEIAGNEPVILSGDFNAPPDSEPYEVLLSNQFKDTFSQLPPEKRYSPGYTFNGWDVEANRDRYRIDYVFYKGEELNPVKYQVLDGQRGKLFISDHFPVIIKFQWEDSSDHNK